MRLLLANKGFAFRSVKKFLHIATTADSRRVQSPDVFQHTYFDAGKRKYGGVISEACIARICYQILKSTKFPIPNSMVFPTKR
eukprot:3726196-Amphidinium_carterae.1